MASYNRVELMGTVFREPEAKSSATGEQVCVFSVMVTQEVLNLRNEPIQETCYVDVEATGNLGQLVLGNFHKDTPVIVEGHLKMERTFDRNTGRNRTRLYVAANLIQVVENSGGPIPEPPDLSQGQEFGQMPPASNDMTF